ncbi:Protein MAIN-LIKE 2 [Bienertia sinuspersici]
MENKYSFQDINVMRAFCECWCPTTNTLHTQMGELSISLRDLYTFACDFLLYHYLQKQPESKKGVSAQQWVKYWYK